MSNTARDWIGRSEALNLRVRNFVNGRWQSEEGETSIEKYSPRDGRLLCHFGAGRAQEVEDAVTSARRAFEDGRWSRLAPQRRKEVLLRLASLIEAHREEFALLECLDVGKPITDALNIDIPMAVGIIKFCAEALEKFPSKVWGVDRSSLSYQLRRPRGVVAGIVGWNFPLVLASGKLGPVLATGNCLVLKPSELTSFSAARVAELAIEAGVPEGVFNVVNGNPGVGAALARHHDVDLVTFTGSTRTGKKLLIASGESNMKQLVLECGGKAANIVFDDCPNLNAVADAVVERAFWNQGQVCTASSRLLVQESIKGELLRIVIEKVSALNPGDPLNPETKFAALVSHEHKKKVLDYINSAEEKGTQVAYRSDAPPPFEEGFYVSPTIFDNVSPEQDIAQEEVFGPVLSTISFGNEQEAIRIANGTIYGLSAILWTKDMGRAHRLTQDIDAGWIVVNSTDNPTGGPGMGVLSVGGHKQSGIGVEGGVVGLEAYTTETAVQHFV